ncbi:hypothetical protein G3I60_28920 [Streptomyces sp. SID13666]|nr:MULTISPECIES: hypothetical protein [unclassified Streptomyces]NEA58072.1 hypothetical protein [Streptomyces sp. SID13666]NEA74076.1 hypothetical protein [Streptomyces sp. SID13588]
MGEVDEKRVGVGVPFALVGGCRVLRTTCLLGGASCLIGSLRGHLVE